MKKIIKKLLKRDNLGKVHHQSIQELMDDELGTIEETTESTFTVCENCTRPVEKLNELLGCDRCGRACCDKCAVQCAVCSRRICANCRRGFAEKQLAVCPECQLILKERQQYHDSLLQDKLSFERLIAVYRDQVQLVKQGMFHAYPCGDLLEQLAELKLMGKLNKLEKAIRNHEKGK